jgi:cobalt/nickel transport system permease protein
MGLTTAGHDVATMDDLARLDSPMHRLDARAKVLATLVVATTAISFDPHALAPLAPLALYPAVVIGLGRLPIGLLARRLAIAAPFVLCVGAFNPLWDREVVGHLGRWAVTGGWVSFGSISARLALTLLAGLLLVATTPIAEACRALERLGVPRVLTTQILLMHRYLFVLSGEAERLLRARALRGGGRSVSLAQAGPLAGQWLLRALDRAGRAHRAMLLRGFDGAMPPPAALGATRRGFGLADAAWVVGWAAFCLATRLGDPVHWIGRATLAGWTALGAWTGAGR